VYRVVLLLLVAVVCTHAQTTIDLVTQTRNVDFAGATTTRPFKVGSSLPAICRQGEMFFRVGAATEVLYACTATNVWTLQNGSGPTAVLGTGLVAQTSAGPAVRSLIAGNGLVITNSDGLAGNPDIRADIASQTEAEGGHLLQQAYDAAKDFTGIHDVESCAQSDRKG
jgi:hypothetical protein